MLRPHALALFLILLVLSATPAFAAVGDVVLTEETEQANYQVTVVAPVS